MTFYRRNRRHQRAHERLQDWASWKYHYTESSALGARIVDYNADRSGGAAHAIVPDVFSSPEIAQAEVCVNEMTPTVQRHIMSTYVLGPDSPGYVKVNGKQREYMLRKVAEYLCL